MTGPVKETCNVDRRQWQRMKTVQLLRVVYDALMKTNSFKIFIDVISDSIICNNRIIIVKIKAIQKSNVVRGNILVSQHLNVFIIIISFYWLSKDFSANI